MKALYIVIIIGWGYLGGGGLAFAQSQQSPSTIQQKNITYTSKQPHDSLAYKEKYDAYVKSFNIKYKNKSKNPIDFAKLKKEFPFWRPPADTAVLNRIRIQYTEEQFRERLILIRKLNKALKDSIEKNFDPHIRIDTSSYLKNNPVQKPPQKQ